MSAIFTLPQAVAWIAWRDPSRPLLPKAPEDKSPASMVAWLQAREELDQHVHPAAKKLAAAIDAGHVAARGMRVTIGSPGAEAGALSAEPATPILTSPQTTCTIPVEYLEVSNGGWLVLNDRLMNGWDTGPRFCRVTVDAEQVRAIRPLDAETESAAAQNPEPSGPDAHAVELREASEVSIRKAIQNEYSQAKQDGRKPPNVKEICPLVLDLLKHQGLTASKRHVAAIAGTFKGLRGKRGVRWNGGKA